MVFHAQFCAWMFKAIQFLRNLIFYFQIFDLSFNNLHYFTLFTVSDRCSAGETDDKSGQMLRDLVSKHYGATITSALVPDEIDKIEVS